ncbi:hypothetical protein JCM33374_g3378 [Metschnikowia sp. JCM 33374]|nr:hypothetical protein JCM33374_g3378 [Metschnikowia sp. JCM 33374]
MSPPSQQIYSATYSNVPVFEFVTPEGPIMRRKSDSWINATHILKIAKFPKARRTRILEKDVQTGIHEKVQGGYGKYQGTYVPLALGAEIARTFGVYEVLEPIFAFEYIEGKSATPPPAPKHNHASASNVARRQVSQTNNPKHKRDPHVDSPGSKRMKMELDSENGTDTTGSEHGHISSKEKPKRVALPHRGKPPALNENKTVPIQTSGPSIGTFSSNTRPDPSFSGPHGSNQHQLPPLVRQDTERDALSIMASNMNVRQADLEADHSDEDDTKAVYRGSININKHDPFSVRESDDDEFMSGKELFGSRAFVVSQNLLSERGSHRKTSHNRSPDSAHKLLSLNGSISGDTGGAHNQPNLAHEMVDDAESAEYFNTLLNYLMEDNSQHNLENSSKQGSFELPEKVLNPPQPLNKININRPVDDDGNTIFHWACSMANVGMIEFLLSIFSNFINSEVKNFNGETPLMFLVQFRNSYQLNNFPVILDLLFDSILSVDKLGRTVLHHIALACDFSKFDNTSRNDSDSGFRARKERFANYYFDVVFSKIVGFPDYQLSHGDEKRNLEDKKEVISKFINHQDNNGNTAFHIVAHNMSKKCIKTFIGYHKFIDLSLRNHVNFSVEDYLASHNFVLRLENEDGSAPHANDVLVPSPSLFPVEDTKSFETQLHKTRRTVNFHNTAVNMVTEKLGELSYLMDKELNQKDDKLYSLYKFFKIIGLEKFKSQKAVLELVNLHYLVEDIAKDYGDSENGIQDDTTSDLVISDGSKDKVIQEEISRLMNDSTFQKITSEEKLSRELLRYKFAREKATELQLQALRKDSLVHDSKPADMNNFELSVLLQKQILKRKALSKELYEQEAKVPLLVGQRGEFKENSLSQGEATSGASSESHLDKTADHSTFSIANYPSTDKLYKYCKLVALSCGMTMTEAENNIDLIEQSLAKAANGS